MNIRFLETFVWLAKLENFRLTAEKLHTTQAAVSSRIASLEEAFDVRLFDRNTRSATLTPAGRRMLAYAERIVRLDGEMRRDIDAASDAGLIRIGVIESIVHSWFPTLMAQLRERYPRLDVEITSDTTLHLIRLLSTDGVDLILQTDPVPRFHEPAAVRIPGALGGQPAPRSRRPGARRRAPRGIPDHQLRATQPARDDRAAVRGRRAAGQHQLHHVGRRDDPPRRRRFRRGRAAARDHRA